MAQKIRKATNPRQVIRLQKKVRIKKKIALHKGEIPRMVVYRSNSFLYVQVVDDAKAITIAQANTREESFAKKTSKKNLEVAKSLGELVAKRALEKNITKILFDRNGYDYHGRVKAIAEGAREAGLIF
jgi:large subunit ribosomal protein L18